MENGKFRRHWIRNQWKKLPVSRDSNPSCGKASNLIYLDPFYKNLKGKQNVRRINICHTAMNKIIMYYTIMYIIFILYMYNMDTLYHILPHCLKTAVSLSTILVFWAKKTIISFHLVEQGHYFIRYTRCPKSPAPASKLLRFSFRNFA